MYKFKPRVSSQSFTPAIVINEKSENTGKAGERMKGAGKSHKVNGKPSVMTRKDWKSATGMSGSPKKGGHGGKFTWISGQGYSHLEMGLEALDAKDSNFEDLKDIVAV